MPTNFSESMGLVHNTKPMMDKRGTDPRNLVLGVGILEGFVISPTTPNSTSVNITRGLAVGPDGKQIRGAVDPQLSQSDFNKAIRLASFPFDLKANFESLSGAWASIDPAANAVLVTLDIVNEKFRALNITVAEATAIEAAIASGETGNAIAAFDAATADHRARLSGSFASPESQAVVAVATEYILGVATLAGVGTVISGVSQRRERKQVWGSMAV